LQPAFVIGASGILLALVSLRLPLTLDRGETPFEHGQLRSISPAYALLTKAAAELPDGASVVAVTEPRDPLAETNFFRAAVGLMPRQNVLPAARWGTPTPEYERQAEYVVVLGLPAVVPGADRLFQWDEGTLWRRRIR
jgi:hypothetical protein